MKIAKHRTKSSLAGQPDLPAAPVSAPASGRGQNGGLIVVGIGASAGGLEACRKLVDQIAAGGNMAFILVQHLDPNHESMMVNLLTSHTALKVVQAGEGMQIEADHFYIIPPGKYLAVQDGALHLSQPAAPHGARLPFDFLLNSLAAGFKERAVCIVLSGTGADGSLGLRAIKQAGGRIIVQQPEEAAFDGMPRSAIATGLVDHILPVAEISAALTVGSNKNTSAAGGVAPAVTSENTDWLHEIIGLLRKGTAHDFTLYKSGTLKRRIARRMAMAAISGGDLGRYFNLLQENSGELELLAKDLLINITSFFRDTKIFDDLAQRIIPEIVRNHTSDQPLRIWTAGCSTGEETYSLAMLFREAIAAQKGNIKLQVFASDADPDAVASARLGIYPESIRAQVSSQRLAQFFVSEEHKYRILPELRAMVVFTVQDVLSDPPFSRLDFVSCRNLLIYLGTEAQTKVIAAFHFALREGGMLLLGSSETIAHPEGRFETVSKSARLYRRIGHSRLGEFGFAVHSSDPVRAPQRAGHVSTPSRQGTMAELVKQAVQDDYAPAAIVLNRQHECLYFSGPTSQYLRVASGHASQDFLAMVPQALRSRLRTAIDKAFQEKQRVSVAGGSIKHEGAIRAIRVEIRPLPNLGEELLLVCLIDEPKPATRRSSKAAGADLPHVAELERELAATRAELLSANRNLEMSSEEQKAINEEALSVNEEFQSTNEELLTSKEELQSLNEELTALNSQLQETLERQRTSANDLQNILYSTDVATMFLDTSLNIRFFTPATKSLFNILPGDVGRPLADLHSLANDGNLAVDARNVLKNHEPVEREIRVGDGMWFNRRILPYRGIGKAVEGVVITFTDITERKRIRVAMVTATQVAEQANLAKSRFLAAASHDLRQPLQTLALLQSLLSRKVEGEAAQKLVVQLDETLASMSVMLNTLLDINQIDSGVVHPTFANVLVNDLLMRMRDEFQIHVENQGLALRVVGCGLMVWTDLGLLEQMLRNLLTNAIKYTRTGKILLGARRQGDRLNFEVWDTGIGIPAKDLKVIFDEYHQIDNAARQRSRGLGLGLSIVQRLGLLLDHPVKVRSQSGKGSVFTISVPVKPGLAQRVPEVPKPVKLERNTQLAGTILVVEDDPHLRELLQQVLGDAGHTVLVAADGKAALELIDHGAMQPDIILADFNLPNGLDGLETASKLRDHLRRHVPVIILTGDISAGTLRGIAESDCVHVSKPANPRDLQAVIQRLLDNPSQATTIRGPKSQHGQEIATVHVVDDELSVREAMRAILENEGHEVQVYASSEAFLKQYRKGPNACLLVDALLPGMSGTQMLRQLQDSGQMLPAIMITGKSDVAMAVAAMKAGASDFLEKPVATAELIAGVARILEQARDSGKRDAWNAHAAARVSELTTRQHEIMDRVLAGHPSKNIAADLGISQRTVEAHRASVMKKTGAASLPALARLALAAKSNGPKALEE